jgi:hypothetical protein
MTLPLTMLQNLARQMGKDATNIWQTNIIERYWARPLEQPFIDMCLADFAAEYRMVQKKQNDNEDDDGNDDDTETGATKVYELLDNKGAISKRNKTAVIRYLKISKKKDSERHHATLLRMYMPHRGKQLKPAEDTFEGHFMSGHVLVDGENVSIRDVVVRNMDKYEHDADIIDEAWTAVQNGTTLADGWAEIAPGAEEQRDEERDEAPDEDLSDVEDIPALPDLDVALQVRDFNMCELLGNKVTLLYM